MLTNLTKINNFKCLLYSAETYIRGVCERFTSFNSNTTKINTIKYVKQNYKKKRVGFGFKKSTDFPHLMCFIL